MIVDAKPRDLGLPTDAYYAVEEIHDVSGTLHDSIHRLAYQFDYYVHDCMLSLLCNEYFVS